MFAYCFNNPLNMDDTDGNWPKLVKAIAVALMVTAVVALTAGMAAYALGASTVIANGVMVGALAGGGVSAATNISMQSKKKGTKKISYKEVAKSTFWGAVSGVPSGGISACSSAAVSTTQQLVNKGMQVGANVLISQSAYVMQECFKDSENKMGLKGLGTATMGGVISGCTFNYPLTKAIPIAFGLEVAGYSKDIIDIFKENVNEK